MRTERRVPRALAAALVAPLLAASFCGEPAARDPVIAPGRIRDAGTGRRLVALVPPEARAGEVFQRQPNGKAALAVLGVGLTRGDVVHWGGRPLETTYASSRLVTAAIPPELLASPGDVPVTIESSADPSLPKLRGTFRLTGPFPGDPVPAGSTPTPAAGARAR